MGFRVTYLHFGGQARMEINLSRSSLTFSVSVSLLAPFVQGWRGGLSGFLVLLLS